MLADEAAAFPGDERTARARRADFERLWQQHRPRIWRLIARLAGSADLADDLTQEVSLRAFQAFDRFGGRASFSTWLYRIAVNVVIRHRERLRPEAVSLDAPEVARLPEDAAAGRTPRSPPSN